MRKYNIAFVCVHNSCRSQMAEAIAKLKYNDMFDAYSAGTHIKNEINQDAVKIIIKMYDYDMNQDQKNKLISDIPEMDIVITMGCNVDCPTLACNYREDFGLDDPTGQDEMTFELTAKIIDEKINTLYLKLKYGEIKIK